MNDKTSNVLSAHLSGAPPDAPAPAEALYATGTLRYTTRSLAVLFGWLLWGDFAFSFFESIFSRFIPLYLKDLQASNTLIGVMTGSIAGMVNIFFLPNISQWSDRYRSRWGRRIPFLFWSTPITVASLILIGFAPEIGGWLHGNLLSAWAPRLSKHAVILTLLCGCVVSYHLFNMVLVFAYTCLLRDVVPQRVMGRFLSWFRIVGTVALFAFLWYVFPRVVSYRKLVCAGIGTFYLISFLLMCSRFREGEYPPPPSGTARNPGILISFGRYFRDCLGIPIYRNFFITYVLMAAAAVSTNPFLVLYARDSLGLSMDDMGKIFAWGALASALAYFPVGLMCDRFNPMLVSLAALAGFAPVSALAYFLVHDRTTWLVYSIVAMIPSVGWGLGSMALSMALFPKKEFGQFSSGLNVFGCGGLILGNYLAGEFMDWTHSFYRLIFVWATICFILALIPMIGVYREWKRHGGPHHYVPPLPDWDQPIYDREE